MPSWLGGTIGIVILIALWEILAVTVFRKTGSGVPTPTSVVSTFWSDWKAGLYGENIIQTMKEAATGYVVANVLAIVLAVAFMQIPLVEKALLRIAIASYCLPILAVGPILTFVLHGDAPKSALAGLVVFFPTLVGVLVGLRSADRTALDLVRAMGGGSWMQLYKVRFRAALPSTFAALQIAAPSAILGAIIGEYLGAQAYGLGILLITAGTSLQDARTWAIAMVCMVISCAAYFLTGIIGRLLSPWAAIEKPRRPARASSNRSTSSSNTLSRPPETRGFDASGLAGHERERVGGNVVDLAQSADSKYVYQQSLENSHGEQIVRPEVGIRPKLSDAELPDRPSAHRRSSPAEQHLTVNPTPSGAKASPLARSSGRSAALSRLAPNMGWALVSIIVTLALWEGFLRLYHIPPIVGKAPLDIWRYLFTQHANAAMGLRSAAENRTVLFDNLKITLRDAALGYVAGIVLAIAVSCVFVVQRAAQQTFMPIALVLRSVPLIIVAPLMTLLFGRSILIVCVIGGIVCLFPALVNIMHGLRTTPQSFYDLMAAYGASPSMTLRKILIPSAVPSIFASLRINVPASIVGALLAEWLATGKGSGNEMLTVSYTFDYGELWSAVVLVTLVSVVIYSVVAAVESAVLLRYAPETAGLTGGRSPLRPNR